MHPLSVQRHASANNMFCTLPVDHSKTLPVYKDPKLPFLGFEKEISIYPIVEHASWIHRIVTSGRSNEPELTAKLLEYIEGKNATYIYKYASERGIFDFDAEKYNKMDHVNQLVLKHIDDKINEFSKYDDLAVRNTQDYSAHFLSSIGCIDEALSKLIEYYDSNSTTTGKIDNLLHRCRIGFFKLDRNLVNESLQSAKSLCDKSGDWHLKNITYAYTALNSLWNRDISSACTNFLNCVSSFSSFDVMNLPTFCSYTAITSLLVLPREKFNQKIINGHEVQEGLYNAPIVSKICQAFSTCDYLSFMTNLKLLIRDMYNDPYCTDHTEYLCREFRLKAYKQLLISYKSLTLEYLSEVFGFNVEFIESDIAKFIARGDLNCKIDLVRRMVIVSQCNSKSSDFAEFLSSADKLIGEIHFIERSVNE